MLKYLGPLVLGLAGVGILVSLGFWQLHRLQWKEGILHRIEARIAAPPEPLPAKPDEARDEYLPVTVTGRIGGPELHVLVSVKDVGPGWRIIAPFKTGDRTVLLDRGFVPDGQQDRPHPGGEMTVTGNLHWPDDRNTATPENDVLKNIWFARDIAEMAKVLGTEPVLIVARSKTGNGIMPIPIGTEGIPNNHMQYAITWFSLAAAWAGMTGLWLWRKARPTEKGSLA